MILRTTRCRYQVIVRAAGDDIDLLAELAWVSGGSAAPKSHVEGDICYSAGVKLRELMIERCYTDRKTMRRGLSSSEFGALKDLAAATNEEARHPALRGIGMEGHHARVFPAWPAIEAEQRHSPFPIAGCPFVVLRPMWQVDDHYPSKKITLWSPDGPDAPAYTRLDDELLHWRFA